MQHFLQHIYIFLSRLHVRTLVQMDRTRWLRPWRPTRAKGQADDGWPPSNRALASSSVTRGPCKVHHRRLVHPVFVRGQQGPAVAGAICHETRANRWILTALPWWAVCSWTTWENNIYNGHFSPALAMLPFVSAVKKSFFELNWKSSDTEEDPHCIWVTAG